MTGTTHRIGGLLAGAILIEHLHLGGGDSGILLCGSVFGSLLPDIDNIRSSISYRLPVIAVAVNICQKLIRMLSRIFPGKLGENIRSMIGHRGIFHSLLLPLLLGALMFILTDTKLKIFMLGSIVGILSHLLLDMFSGGVLLFMPIYMRRIKLAGIRTGGMVEMIVRVALLIWGTCLLKDMLIRVMLLWRLQNLPKF
uniref:metal-dependent hydrolase n=1 Tax=Acetatifactor sp. TaxID=1872090 RepID=UPI004057A7E2